MSFRAPMNAARARRRLGWVLVVLSLALHFFTVVAFTRQPDRLAAFTVVPVWMWGIAGLALSCTAFLCLRASLSLIVSGIWAITILVCADEARVLPNFTKEIPVTGPAAPSKGLPVMRVVTLNCGHFAYGDPIQDLQAWQPDITLLQEVSPLEVRKVADALYGGRGDYRFHDSNGVVTRWKITREVRNSLYRDQQVTVMDAGGREFEVVNMHLTGAATDLRLWKPSAWLDHKKVREDRRQELSVALQLVEQTTPFPSRPILLGGDFNSPASDPVHSLLSRDFADAFEGAGRGWGNTFQRRVPILRLDCVYATRQLVPVRCRAVTTRASDHRLVVADFVWK